MTLKSALTEIAASDKITTPHLGGHEGPAATTVDGTKIVYDRLQAVSTTNNAYFRVCFGAVVALFVGAFALVLYSLDHPQYIAGIFAVTGLSIMGLVRQMTRLWKDKVNSDLLLVLAANLQPGDLSAIMNVLLRSYK